MIPWERLTTVFLDAGNTLISVDFEWIATEVRTRGHAVDAAALRRAEAAARPALDAWLAGGVSTEAEDTFTRFVRQTLDAVPALAGIGAPARAELARELRPVLQRPGEADRLWRAVLPGVPEALARLRAAGLTLAVVSNADGSCERGLAAAGLREHLHHVVDSALVGFEKPDPRIFHEALRRCEAAPGATLHVGDLHSADVVGARAAGVHAALLDPHGDRGEVDCEVLPDVTALAERILSARG